MRFIRYNWACFNCRYTTRRFDTPRCAECGRECTFLGPKIRVPPKSNVRQWERLFQLVMAHRRRWQLHSERYHVRVRHQTERYIEKLRHTKPNNPTHARYLRQQIRLYCKRLGIPVEN